LPVPRPELIVFDVNETLSDMEPIRARLAELGAPPGLADSWFPSTLRDGFALTAAGSYAPFAAIARTHLGPYADPVLETFANLGVHPDVADGMRLLREVGIRMVTLSNGASATADGLLERAGVLDLVERRLSVDDVRRWKPAPEPYLYAAEVCGVDAADAMLVAVHPWDVDGAKRAGLQAGWIDRELRSYPPMFAAPDVQGATLVTLAAALAEWRYVNGRRFLVSLERTLQRATQWVVFEPNDEATWERVTQSAGDVLLDVWRGGGLAGATPDEAYFVRCDRTTMTESDIESGRLVCLVGVAPVRPAEFVDFRIGQWTAAASNASASPPPS
jgi:2-haloacid dehalogenase